LTDQKNVISPESPSAEINKHAVLRFCPEPTLSFWESFRDSLSGADLVELCRFESRDNRGIFTLNKKTTHAGQKIINNYSCAVSFSGISVFSFSQRFQNTKFVHHGRGLSPDTIQHVTREQHLRSHSQKAEFDLAAGAGVSTIVTPIAPDRADRSRVGNRRAGGATLPIIGSENRTRFRALGL
jgi:hypothetical protein